MHPGLDVVVSVDVAARPYSTVRGRLESPYGDFHFAGWLELLGRLEDIVDRARRDLDGSETPTHVS